MCALRHRRNTGRGQYIGLSQYEATVAAFGHVMLEQLANGGEPRRAGNRSLRAAPHGCYRCKGEDRWCAIAVFGEPQWRRFCDIVKEPGWAEDPRFATLAARLEHADELDRRIEGWTSAREAYEVMACLQKTGIAAGVAQNAKDLFEHDRQLAERAFFEEVEHLEKGTEIATGVPLGLTGTPGRTTRTGVALGQDNDYVFGELLGLSPQEIRECIEAGAIETADA
jgi:crotonobetainyl-CoA:carnitine CoA-transferase CaiB-like acyl-CoA transferase